MSPSRGLFSRFSDLGRRFKAIGLLRRLKRNPDDIKTAIELKKSWFDVLSTNGRILVALAIQDFPLAANESTADHVIARILKRKDLSSKDRATAIQFLEKLGTYTAHSALARMYLGSKDYARVVTCGIAAVKPLIKVFKKNIRRRPLKPFETNWYLADEGRTAAKALGTIRRSVESDTSWEQNKEARGSFMALQELGAFLRMSLQQVVQQEEHLICFNRSETDDLISMLRPSRWF